MRSLPPSGPDSAPRAAIPLGTALGLVAAAAAQALAADAVAMLLWSEREGRLAPAVPTDLGDLAANALASLPASSLWRAADAPARPWWTWVRRATCATTSSPSPPAAVVTIPPEGGPAGVLVALRHQDASASPRPTWSCSTPSPALGLEWLDTAQLEAGEVPESAPREVEDLKSSLVSIVSHELQTPVSVIKAHASRLTREDVGWNLERVRQLGATIEEACDRLHRLVVDLLDLARSQAGRVAVITAATPTTCGSTSPAWARSGSAIPLIRVTSSASAVRAVASATICTRSASARLDVALARSGSIQHRLGADDEGSLRGTGSE